MDVRLKIGRDAGEIRDIAPEAARAMLADGRAEPAYADQLPPVEFACGGDIPAEFAPVEGPHHAALRKHAKKAAERAAK